MQGTLPGLPEPFSSSPRFIYKIPIMVRSSGSTNWGPEKLICVDNVGLYFRYNKKKDLIPSNIRRYLTGRRSSQIMIEADSILEAIEKFYTIWEGARTGGKSEESRAMWIGRNEYDVIKEYPHCEILNRNKEDRLICGEVDPLEEDEKSPSGVGGWCIFENEDFSDDDEDHCSVVKAINEKKYQEYRLKDNIIVNIRAPVIDTNTFLFDPKWPYCASTHGNITPILRQIGITGRAKKDG